MLRIKADALSLHAGKYCYEDQLFSGTAYFTKDNIRFTAVVIVDGLSTDQPASPIASSDEVLSGIDISGYREFYPESPELPELRTDFGLSCCEVDFDIQLFLNGVAYDGVGYAFWKGFCCQEVHFSDGFADSSADWNLAGTLLELSRSSPADAYYAWHDNAVLKCLRISDHEEQDGRADGKFEIDLTVKETGLLNSLSLEGNLDAIEEVLHAESCSPIRSLQDLGKYAAGEVFHLHGDTASREVFDVLNMMFERGVFDATAHISAYADVLQHDGCVEMFSKLKNLRRLTFNAMPEGYVELARQIKIQRPDLLIEAECIIPGEQGMRNELEITAELDLGKYKAGKYFFFNRNVVKPEVFEHYQALADYGFFDATMEIRTYGDMLHHPACVDLLVKLKNLRRLKIEDMHEENLEVARQIKIHRPELFIEAEYVIPGEQGLSNYYEITGEQGFGSHKAFSNFKFMGNVADPEVFAHYLALAEHGVVDATREIHTYGDILRHPGSVDMFVKLKKLRRLTFEVMCEEYMDMARQIKQQRPDIIINVDFPLRDEHGRRIMREVNGD